MNHYENQETTIKKDQLAINKVLALDPEGLINTCGEYSITMCGVISTAIMLIACKELGATKAELVEHTTSGDVSGDIDADRMDYLVRDSHYTGVAYGVFDVARLIDKTYFDGKRLIIRSGGLRAAESLLISRFKMYPTVYFHHVCRIARKMYEKALEFLIENGFDAKNLLYMDDYDVISLMRSSKGFAKEIVEFLDSRKLFKRAIYVGRNRVDLKEVLNLNAKRAEEEIADEAKIDRNYLIVDIQPIEEVKEFNALVDLDGELVKLEDASPLVKALKDAEKETWKLGVYTKKEYVDKVRKVAADYFNINRIPMQRTLDEILP